MSTVKIAVTIDQDLRDRLDQLVATNQFRNRSHAVEQAIRDMIQRLRRSRFEREIAKLDAAFEQALAEQGINADLELWSKY